MAAQMSTYKLAATSKGHHNMKPLLNHAHLKSIYIDRRPPTRIHRPRKAIEPAWVGQRYSTTTVRPGSGLATKPRLSNPNNISGATVNTVACIDNAITADD